MEATKQAYAAPKQVRRFDPNRSCVSSTSADDSLVTYVPLGGQNLRVRHDEKA